MFAVIANDVNCDLEKLAIVDVNIPQIKLSDQVLIKIRYASINPVDYKLLANHPQIWSYPYIPCLDFVGEVVEVGSHCNLVRKGDLVAAHANLTYGGALAEYIVQPEHVLFKIPAGVDLKLAAAMPCAGLTAYQALVRKMNVQAGKTIFIQAGSGGVGSFAIIIAKQLGLTVISSCSSRNHDYVKSLGTDYIIDYTSCNVFDKIKELFPSGVDYILETTNKDNLQSDWKILSFNGQLASIVGIINTQEIPEFTTGFGFHEVALGGAYLSNHYPSQCDLAQMGRELLSLLVKANKSPQITEYKFTDFKQAFRDLKTNKNPGKIVINFDEVK